MTDKQVVILAVPGLPQELFLRIGRRVVEELRRAEPAISWVVLNGGLEGVSEEKLRDILRRVVPADWHGQFCPDCIDYGDNTPQEDTGAPATCALYGIGVGPTAKGCPRFHGRTWR